MADDTKFATLRSNVKLNSLQIKTPVAAPAVQASTVEIAPAASVNSTYTMVRIPTAARISGLSRVSFDALASTGAPTLDIGLKPVGSAFVADVDALNDGITVNAAGNAPVIKDIANYGKRAWEHLGLTSDPGGFADVIVTILDAATNTGGTLTVSLLYTVD